MRTSCIRSGFTIEGAMDITTFDCLVQDLKNKRPMWFEGENERLATDADLASVGPS